MGVPDLAGDAIARPVRGLDLAHTVPLSGEVPCIAMSKKVRMAVRTAATCSLVLLVPALALAAAETRAEPCDVVAPDSLEINWAAPCRDGS